MSEEHISNNNDVQNDKEKMLVFGDISLDLMQQWIEDEKQRRQQRAQESQQGEADSETAK